MFSEVIMVLLFVVAGTLAYQRIPGNMGLAVGIICYLMAARFLTMAYAMAYAGRERRSFDKRILRTMPGLSPAERQLIRAN
jgi:hypothetical protein